MSSTFPSRPTVVRTGARGRGRGRGTQTKTQNRPKMQGPRYTTGGAGARPRQPPAQNPTDDQQNGGIDPDDGVQGRIQRRDAYSVVSPNEKKRAEIARQAKQEEEQFRQYKESKKLGHVSYVGTAGGGEMSEAEARRKFQQKQSSSAHERRMKSQKYKDEERQRENAEYDKKKAEARKKAEQNKQADAQRQNHLQEDHRRKNEAFLARFEREAKEKQREKTRLSYKQNQFQENDDYSDDDDDDYNSNDDYSDGGACANPALPTNSAISELGRDLRELHIYFPTYDPKYLEDILMQVNGDVGMAKTLLS